MLKILCAGLSRTGTTSLHQALTMLGMKSIHYDAFRLRDVFLGKQTNPSFRVYEDVDAVSDIPSAYFFKELIAAYPACKVILTVRDIDSWWQSISRYVEVQNPINFVNSSGGLGKVARAFGLVNERDNFKAIVRNVVYGSIQPNEYIYKKRYLEHNSEVVSAVEPSRLLVMDITKGDGWDVLCPFLGVDEPTAPFPNTNQLRK